MSNVKDGDLFMVSRDGTEFQVKNEDTSNLRDTDLFWVQREGVNYSVTADQVNTGGGALIPPELASVGLTQPTTGDRYTDQKFLTIPSYTTLGNPPPAVGLKAEVTGALSLTGGSDEIVGINGGTLTLASDANLANGVFKAGDAVKQNNSPVVPVSSAITNVSDLSGNLVVTGVGAPYETDIAAAVASGDGDMTAGVPMSDNVNADGTVKDAAMTPNDIRGASTAVLTFDPPLPTTTVLNVYGGARANAAYRSTKTVYYSDGTSEVQQRDSSNNNWYWVNVFNTGGRSVSSVTMSAADDNVVGGVTLGDNNFITDYALTILTLQDSTGLSDFEVGDVVETGVNATSNVTTGTYTFDKFVADWNAGEPNGYVGATTKGQYIEFAVPSAGTLRLKGGRISSYNVNIIATGDFNGGTRSFTWGIGADITTQDFTFASAGVVRLTVDNASNGFYLIHADSSWLGSAFLVNKDFTIIAIDEATPSIYTDGGTWNVGEVVTGPPKPITATFVSADPLVPSMTVSDVVGPWSANTGNYVENTVVNPIMIKPETSAITSVGESDGAWTSATATAANGWRSITYGNGKFVAISQDGTNRVMYSTDGINWTAATAAEANSWYSVTYGNGKFVAVSKDGTNSVMYSTDAINWTSASAAVVSDWSSVTYGNGKFVAVAGITNSSAMYSPDGINWTSATAPSGNWWSVTYGNGKFVAVAYNGTNRVMYSADGISWAAATAAETNQWWSVTFGHGKFVAVSYSGDNRVMYSTDGISWTSASAAENNGWLSVTYGNGKFVAIANSGVNRVMYSTDGISWTGVLAAEDNYWISVTYGNGKFVAVAFDGTNRVMWSLTGTGAQTELTLTDDTDLNQFANGDAVYADSSYTPTSSAITNVDALSGTYSSLMRSGANGDPYDYDSATEGEDPAAPFVNAFDGDTATKAYGKSSSTAFLYCVIPGLSSTDVLEINVGYFDASTVHVNGVITEMPGAITNSSPAWFTIPHSGGTVTTGWQSITSSARIAAVRVNGTILLDSYSFTNLELTDDTDLENFRVGDVVQELGAVSVSIVGVTNAASAWRCYNNSGTLTYDSRSNPLEDFPAAYDALTTEPFWNIDVNYPGSNSGAVVGAGGATTGGTITWNYTGTGTIALKTAGYGNNGRMQVSGDVVEAGSIITFEGNRGNPYYLKTLTPTSSSGTFSLTWLDSGTQICYISYVGPYSSKVTGIDEAAPSITTDGGIWNTGDVVTGQTLEPATGTVASTDPTGPTMALSESNGRWCTNTKVTKDEGPALSTTASLVFDANGQVSDVVSDADFVNMNSTTPIVTLPSTFGDGSTPDETLPDGTSIKTTVRAWNALGESIKSSNTVTPTTTTRLAMGETRLIDGYTPIVTAHARAVVKEADKIQEDINKATDQFNLARAKYEEQGKRRSV